MILRVMLPAAVVATAAITSAGSTTVPFSGNYVSGIATHANGTRFLYLVDAARRMFAAGDPEAELMTFSGVYDSSHFGATEGSIWSGNIWTQNSYGVGFASLPFLPQPQLNWLQTGFLWWFDHMGDGGQTFGGLPDTPDGMLCDNGNPSGCNYMQCGAGGRRRRLKAKSRDKVSNGAEPEPVFPSKRRDTYQKWEATQDFASKIEDAVPTLEGMLKAKANEGAGDTAAVGHDWVIGGTLAGGVMQAEMLLETRNLSAVRHFLPMLARISNFMEGRRVQDPSPLTPGSKGLFRAGNGANLLAPAFGGWPLPVGCVVNATFSNCTQRAMSYLTELTVTYSAMLDRMIELSILLEPPFGNATVCSHPNGDARGPSSCIDVWRARRKANDASIPGVLERMNSTGSYYLIRSMDPNGDRHGVYAPRAPCPPDELCPAVARHGYFESAPNHDIVGLRVANDELAQSIYQSMISIDGLRPCDFTIPNFPDYDDSCGGCDGGFGTWVSGGSWSTAEGRAILAHFRGGRPDLAANSMGRILDPYAKLFKLDNPIAHQGCGPGMYSQISKSGMGDVAGRPILDVDIFGIPAAFLHGLFGYKYGATALVLEPTLPSGVSVLEQNFPVRYGNLTIFLSLSGVAPPPMPPPSPPRPPSPPPPGNEPWSCALFNCNCQDMMNYYGGISGAGFGCAPIEAQQWWDHQGIGKGCGGATKTNGTFCDGPGCTASNPCATKSCKTDHSFTCKLCNNGSAASACPNQGGSNVPGPKLPKVVYKWWQLPTKVEIDGEACADCLDTSHKRQVTLDFARLQLAAGSGSQSIKVDISFGGSVATHDGDTKPARDTTGAAAQQRWDQVQAQRSTVSPTAAAAAAPGCALSPIAEAAFKNVSAFSVAMLAAGLADRFENFQAMAVKEALNVSVTRCSRRQSGAIKPIPVEPASWKKFNMGYNQSLAEAYFTDQWMRIWTGLVNLMAAYEVPTQLGYTPLHLQIAALFKGKGVKAAAAIKYAAEQKVAAAKVTQLKKMLAAAEEEVEELKSVGAQM